MSLPTLARTPLGRVDHLLVQDEARDRTLCGKDTKALHMSRWSPAESVDNVARPTCRACVSARDYGSKHEAPAIGAMASRVMRSLVRRAEEGDVEALQVLIGLQDTLQAAVTEAGQGLHARGFSFGYIAAETGVSRQAAAKRFASTKGQAKAKPGEPEGTATLLDALAEAGVA